MTNIYRTSSPSSIYHSSLKSLLYCLGMMIGCRRALAKASAEYGDLPSVRITLPIDMKKLSIHGEQNPPWPGQSGRVCVPECGTRSKHVLAERSHHSVRAGTISHDIKAAF